MSCCILAGGVIEMQTKEGCARPRGRNDIAHGMSVSSVIMLPICYLNVDKMLPETYMGTVSRDRCV